MTALLNDLRYAFRTLIKARAFTAVAVLTLALAVGANTAMFGALNALVLRPLPFYQPDRLAMIWENNPKLEGLLAERVPTCLKNYLDWQSQSKSFEDMAAMFDVNLNLTGIDKPEQVETAKGSDNFFKLMGVGAWTGRTFAPGEGEPGKNRIAILTRPFFEKRFGSGADL